MPLPVGGITLTNVFTLIGHFLGQDTTDTWRSEFHIYKSSGPPEPSDAIVEACVLYWEGNLITTATLDHLELRNATWGDIPYSLQAAIWTSPVGHAGTKTSAYGAEGTAGVGKEVVAYVRVTNSGPKPGKQFIRGFLDNGDIYASVGGQWIFLQSPAVPNVTDTKLQTLIAASGLNAFYGGTPDPRICTTHFSIKEYNINPLNLPFESSVSAIHLIRPSVNKATRKSKK